MVVICTFFFLLEYINFTLKINMVYETQFCERFFRHKNHKLSGVAQFLIYYYIALPGKKKVTFNAFCIYRI